MRIIEDEDTRAHISYVIVLTKTPFSKTEIFLFILQIIWIMIKFWTVMTKVSP